MICATCKEEINEGAMKCKHCNSYVGGAPASKTTLILLTLFLGGIGVHKFYVGSWGWGIVYLLFCATGIPAFLACIEFIRYLFLSNEEIQQKSIECKKSAFSFLW